MGAIFNYILLSSVVMSVLYMVYRLLMHTTTFYRLNRLTLLSIYFLSWIAPLFIGTDLSLHKKKPLEVNLNIGEVAAMVQPSIENEAPNSFISISMWIWGTGILVLSIYMFISLYKLIKIIRSGQRCRKEGYIEVVSETTPSPFSWGKYLVVNPSNLNDDADLIYAHELGHISRKHWIDLLIAQLSIIFQWYSPAAWFMMKRIKEIHEFEVDESISISEKHRYQMMLIKMTAGTRLSVLADSLNQCKLKTRLTMMMTKKSSPSRKINVFAIPAAALVCILGLSTPLVAGISEKISRISIFSQHFPQPGDKVRESSVKLQTQEKVSDNKSAIRPNLALSPEAAPSENSVPVTKEEKATEENIKIRPIVFVDGVLFTGDINSLPADQILSMTIKKDDPAYPQGKILISTRKEDIKTNDSEIQNNKVVTAPETLAEYKGGMKALMAHMGEAITCPPDIKKETRVVVTFTVETDGRIINPKIIKSGGTECDTEAIKAIESTSGNWIPGEVEGKAAPTVYTIPIQFKPKSES